MHALGGAQGDEIMLVEEGRTRADDAHVPGQDATKLRQAGPGPARH